jgi:hypothetical protein
MPEEEKKTEKKVRHKYCNTCGNKLPKKLDRNICPYCKRRN